MVKKANMKAVPAAVPSKINIGISNMFMLCFAVLLGAEIAFLVSGNQSADFSKWKIISLTAPTVCNAILCCAILCR
jgi:hypothetical protein